MTIPEAGLLVARVLGLVYFALLATAGITTGLGLLTLLRIPADPVRHSLLAPFAATLVWALTGNLLVRSGLTMAQAAPWIAVGSLALAVIGIGSVRRMRPRPVVFGILSGGMVLALALVAWPLFSRGLTAHLGSPNLDTAYITSTATAYWHFGLDTASPRSPFFEALAHHVAALGAARNHSYVLLALFSPLVEAGEPVFVRNLFVCWSLLVLAGSLAFYRASWSVAQEGRPASPWVILGYVLPTLGIGWAVAPALVGNWDNALLVPLGPVLAGLAACAPPGPGYPVLLGASVAYAVYTYPELAPFLAFLLLPLHLPGGSAWRRLLPAYAVGAGLALLLMAPGAKPLWAFFRHQAIAARVGEGMRPGGAFAAGLASLPFDLSAWWALGAEHGVRPEELWPRLCAGLLTGLVLVGVVRLGRQGRWRELVAFTLMVGGLVYFAFVDRYGYATYKILSVGSWLAGRCVVEGFAGIVAWSRARSGVAWWARLGHRAMIGALAVGLLTCLAVAERRRFEIFFSRAYLLSQPTLASLARLRAAAARQTPIDAVATQALHHPFMLPWVVYALRDTPVRLHLDAKLTYAVPGGRPWRDGPPPAGVLLPVSELRGAQPRFKTREFALVDLDSTAVIQAIENPNGLESWGTWLGTRPITVSLLARRPMPLTLSFHAAPGPSRPETPRRTLVLHANSREVGRVDIAGPGRVAFRFDAAGGREALTLSTPDLPSVKVLSNGDTRPILVAVRDLTIEPREAKR